MHRTALFSRDRRFRYRLGRRWSDGPKVCFVLLNPSTADETKDDATIRRCVAFAKAQANPHLGRPLAMGQGRGLPATGDIETEPQNDDRRRLS